MYTFLGDIELAALGDLDSLDGFVAGAFGRVFNLVDDFVAFEDFAEDDVAVVEPAGDDGGDEELGAVEVSVCSCSF